MKTLFITVYDGLITKNILRSDVLGILCAHADLSIVLIVPLKKIDYYKREFASDRVFVEAAPSATLPKLEVFFFWLTMFSTPTSGALYRIHAYGRRHILKYFLAHLLRLLGRSSRWRELLSWFYYVIPDRSYEMLLRRYRPQVIFVTNLLSSDDTRLMKTAKRRNIPTVGMVKSWDNVGNKPFVFLHVDRLLVNNEIVKNEAEMILGISSKKIRVVGFPQFDWYIDRSLIIPREEFFKKIGCDPNKKLILYAATGFEWTPHEIEVLEIFDALIEEGKIAEPVEVLVRLHPKYNNPEERMARLKHMRFERPGTTATGNIRGWEYEREDVIHLANSLFHSDICINTASTMAIESMIFDKPTIGIAFDGAHTPPFYESVRRFYSFPHNQKLVALGGEDVVFTPEELLESIKAYLKNPARRAEGRRRTREKECYKLDGQAGKRIANAVLDTLDGTD